MRLAHGDPWNGCTHGARMPRPWLKVRSSAIELEARLCADERTWGMRGTGIEYRFGLLDTLMSDF